MSPRPRNADPTSDLVGVQVGSYRLLSHLGSGSMASVYRAIDVLTRAEVALKVHTRKENEASKRRFLQEARAAGRLHHPGIVEVYEVGAEGEMSFIAMELVRGATLSTLLSAGALPWREVLHLVSGIASALGHAHAAGVMHRDLKPSNVLLTPSGQVKLVDFGLAKRVGDVPDAGDGATVWDWSDVRTQPGAVLGTPAYMAPEQARAVHVDARADVFSLGVLAWEAIAGRPLFRRATPATTLRAILTETPPELGKQPGSELPSWFSALIARTLAKNPEDRFEDARELLTSIKDQNLQLDLPVEAISRIAERRSMVLAEPPFSGRARELDLATTALENIGGAVVVLAIPGAGRKRLARRALADLGATRPLQLRFTDGAALQQAYLERPYDSVMIDAGSGDGDEVLKLAREALGERVRVAVIAERCGPCRAPLIRLAGLSPREGVELLVRGLASELQAPSSAVNQDAERLLADIVRGVGGHAQSLLTIAMRFASEEPAAIAASLELEEGWPEILSAMRQLRGWIEAQLDSLSGPLGQVLTAFASVPSLADGDAPAVAHAVLGSESQEEEVDGLIRHLLSTPLLTIEVPPQLLGARRLAVPSLVRRAIFERGEGETQQRAREVLLSRVAKRASELSLCARTHPEQETSRELMAERTTLLSLAKRALDSASAHEDAALALVSLSEVEALEGMADIEGEADHLLGRALVRGNLGGPLTLRALVSRCARRLDDPLKAGGHHGLDDALTLSVSLKDRGAQARMLLARAARHEQLSAEPAAAMRSDVEAALNCLTGQSPPWLRQDVLEHAGELRWSLGEPDAARGALRNALSLAEERSDDRAGARIGHRLARLSVASAENGEQRLALSQLYQASNEETSALERAIASGAVSLAARIEASLAELAILAGDSESARTHLDRAARHGRCGVGRAALVAGHLELIDGRLGRARALYGAAISYAERQQDEPALAVAHAALAAVLAASQDRPNASDSLVRATLAARTQPPSLRSVVAGWRGHLERAFADRDRAVDGSADEARFQRAEAHFFDAGLVSGLASEAGTGSLIGAHILRALAARGSSELKGTRDE